ncbi:MAG TPA: hypothetical protein VIL48_21345 [Acidimicrobiales bacterium]
MRKTVTTTLAALSLLFVAACGSSGDGDEDAAPRRSTTTTEATSPGESTTTTEATSPGEPRPDDDPENNEICEGQTPVWAYAPSDREARAELVAAHPEGRARPAQTREECARREPELGTGDVQITLRWESDADLDLHVTEPNGTEIWYADKGPTATGGQLDVDSNVSCRENGSVENVFWPTGRMPLGEYTVEVNGFTVDGCGGGEYTVVALVRGEEVLNESGEVGEDETDTYTFTAE